MTLVEWYFFTRLGDISIGLWQADGEGENGVFHMVSLGVVFFSVTFYIYQKPSE